eukprot:m.869166 g.869166  ORF g.869166 m.869166 type:complete len:501 (-) comp23563_c2_seq62:2618-4120(-)
MEASSGEAGASHTITMMPTTVPTSTRLACNGTMTATNPTGSRKKWKWSPMRSSPTTNARDPTLHHRSLPITSGTYETMPKEVGHLHTGNRSKNRHLLTAISRRNRRVRRPRPFRVSHTDRHTRPRATYQRPGARRPIRSRPITHIRGLRMDNRGRRTDIRAPRRGMECPTPLACTWCLRVPRMFIRALPCNTCNPPHRSPRLLWRILWHQCRCSPITLLQSSCSLRPRVTSWITTAHTTTPRRWDRDRSQCGSPRHHIHPQAGTTCTHHRACMPGCHQGVRPRTRMGAWLMRSRLPHGTAPDTQSLPLPPTTTHKEGRPASMRRMTVVPSMRKKRRIRLTHEWDRTTDGAAATACRACRVRMMRRAWCNGTARTTTPPICALYMTSTAHALQSQRFRHGWKRGTVHNMTLTPKICTGLCACMCAASVYICVIAPIAFMMLFSDTTMHFNRTQYGGNPHSSRVSTPLHLVTVIPSIALPVLTLETMVFAQSIAIANSYDFW